MIRNITDCAVLNNGVEIPWLGFGVFLSPPGDTTYSSVRTALDYGYRHIDTAALYENEADVGKAVRDSGIARDEIFVTTKVWITEDTREKTLKAFDRSRKLLDFDIIDLYLVHWPVTGRYVEMYKALEKLYSEGKVRAIGVSNFLVPSLENLLEQADVVPTVNQVEWHPWRQLPELYGYSQEKNIQLEAWAPLMQGKGGSVPAIVDIANKHGKSWAQVLIRWELQKQVVTIPKSNTPSRILENAQVFDFELTAEDMSVLAELDENRIIPEYPDGVDQ